MKIKDTQTEFFKRERQKFKEDVINHFWKKYWVVAILKTIYKKKGLEPSMHPFFSIQRLQYVINNNNNKTTYIALIQSCSKRFTKILKYHTLK